MNITWKFDKSKNSLIVSEIFTKKNMSISFFFFKQLKVIQLDNDLRYSALKDVVDGWNHHAEE